MNLPEKYLNSMKSLMKFTMLQKMILMIILKALMIKDYMDFVLTTLRFQQKIFLR